MEQVSTKVSVSVFFLKHYNQKTQQTKMKTVQYIIVSKSFKGIV